MSTLVDQARRHSAGLNAALSQQMTTEAAKAFFGAAAILIDQLADRVQEMEGNEKFPDVLFDGYAVLQALGEKAKARTSAENVSDVLDAVVRLIRSSPPSSVQPEKEERRPLSDEQIDAAFDASDGTRVGVARAIEAAHGITATSGKEGGND